MLKNLFGGSRGNDDDDDSEVESLLQRVSESRHAGERRDALAQLRDLLYDSQQAQHAMGSMGLPVLLSVVHEDRDDIELLQLALESLVLSFGAGEGPGGTPGARQAAQREGPPPPGVMNAELFARSPDNIRLLLNLLEDEPVGTDDFYCRYHALHALSALLSTAPERVQAAVLSAPLGVIRLMDLLACGREVLRNEALLLLVGLCSGCEEMSKIVAFEGAFERLLALVREEGGPLAGGVLVQDALELINNLLRDSPANQRLFREMGHANELPKLLHYEPPAATAGAEGAMAAAGFVEAAAAAAAAAASANGPGGAARGLAANAAAAAATGAAAAAAAAGAQAMPPQTAANFLVALETARLLLVAPSADDASARSQQASHRAAGQDALGKLGLAAPLIVLCLDEGGVPSAAVRAQALLCLGDLVSEHAKNQDALAHSAVRVRARPAGPAAPGPSSPGGQRGGLGYFTPPPQPMSMWGSPQKSQWQQLPALHAALRTALVSPSPHEAAAAMQLIGAFCRGNPEGSNGRSGGKETFGEELWQALSGAMQQPRIPPLVGVQRAAWVLQHILSGNPQAKERLAMALGGGDNAINLCVKHLSDAARRGDPAGRAACCALVRLLIAWCHESPSTVVQLLAPPGNMPLLVDLAGGRVGDISGSGDQAAHLPGLAALLLGICLLYAPDGAWVRQLQQQQGAAGMMGGAGGTAHVVLDVLLHRLGLSQFFGRLDDMAATRAFQSAKSGPRMPGHITRAAAAAVLDRDGDVAVSFPGQSSQQHQDGVAEDVGVLYDRAFTELVQHVMGSVKQVTLEAFSGGAGGGAGPAAATSAAAVPPPPILPHGAQTPPMHSPSLMPPAPFPSGPPSHHQLLPTPPRPFVPGLEQQQQQQQHVFGGQQQRQAAAVPQGDAAALQQQLAAALSQVSHLNAEVEDLRSRNRALAEDLMRASSNTVAAAAATGSVDAEARAALQLRASRAEMEVGALRQQLGTMQQRWAALEAAVGDAQRERQEAVAAAGKAEADLASLSAAYNALETHSFGLEEQLAQARRQAEEATQAAAAAQAEAAAGQEAAAAAARSAPSSRVAPGFSPEEVEARVAEAVAAALQQQMEQQHRLQRQQEQERQHREEAAASAQDKQQQQIQELQQQLAEVEARMAVATDEARAQASAEADDAMGDLLVCLGQEEAKVAALGARLTHLGEDVDALLAGLAVTLGDGDED